MAKYAENKEILKWIIGYRKDGNKRDANRLGKLFIDIANNYIHNPRFINYHNLHDQMKSDAILYMWKYQHNFNLDFNNPFAYFSTYAWNAFIAVINRYYEEKEIKMSLKFIDNIEKIEEDRVIIKIDKN